MATWFINIPISRFSLPVFPKIREDGDVGDELKFYERKVPEVLLVDGYSRKGMFFVFASGMMTFEFVDEDVFVYVTNLEGIKPEWREKFALMPDVTVWNSFSLRRDEVMWRPHHAAARETREEVTEPRKGERIIGSFSYLDFLWLEPGDLLKVDTGSGIESIPVWKG